MPMIRQKTNPASNGPRPDAHEIKLPLPLLLGLGTALVLVAIVVPFLIEAPPDLPRETAPSVAPEPTAPPPPPSAYNAAAVATSPDPIQPSVDPGSRTAAAQGTPLYLSSEDVRRAQLQRMKAESAAQPTSITERSSLTATPEEIRKMEETGAMAF